MNLLRLFLALFLVSSPASAQVEGKENSLPFWSTDYVASLKQCETSGKPAFVYFSGSNWCGFCKRFDREIVADKDFQDYLKANFEAVNLDFPHPAPKDDPLYELNTWLKQQHGVTGYPTILILDSRGAVLARTGYLKGGAQAFIIDLASKLDGEGAD